MSILIKGIELPKDCKDCQFCIGLADTDYGTCAGCMVDGEYREASSKSGCPLVEIPEHGRLIDADALKETLDYYICEANWGDEVNKGLRWVKDEFINSENTVIEAEGSENHDD